MNVISRKKVREAGKRHPDAAGWIDNWWLVAKHADWQSLQDVRGDYAGTDQVGRCLVFNVKGNTYRFIVGVSYANQSRKGTLFVRHFLTHAEYDKNEWKGDC